MTGPAAAGLVFLIALPFFARAFSVTTIIGDHDFRAEKPWSVPEVSPHLVVVHQLIVE
jgi:hypothetical protein